MSTEVVCPDCGKYIAPEGSIDASARCRCHDQASEMARSHEEAIARATTAKPKTCYVCGKDLTGRKRLKDHLARYWCYECAKADERSKRRAAQNQCPGCSRMFPPHKLFEYNDEKLCKTCYKQRIEDTTRKIRELGHTAARRRYEYKTITGLLIALGLLAVLAILNFFFGPFF
jgi:hypothetical protein